MSDCHPVVYIIDEDARLRDMLCFHLRLQNTDVVGFGSFAGFSDHIREDSEACLIADWRLYNSCAVRLQRSLTDMKSPPTIFMSDCAEISAAVAAMKAGAIEFLTKPVITSSVLSAVSMALAEDRRLRHQSASMLNLTRRLSVLTPREREVLPLVVTGYRNKQSASALGITEITLQIHRRHIHAMPRHR